MIRFITVGILILGFCAGAVVYAPGWFVFTAGCLGGGLVSMRAVFVSKAFKTALLWERISLRLASRSLSEEARASIQNEFQRIASFVNIRFEEALKKDLWEEDIAATLRSLTNLDSGDRYGWQALVDRNMLLVVDRRLEQLARLYSHSEELTWQIKDARSSLGRITYLEKNQGYPLGYAGVFVAVGMGVVALFNTWTQYPSGVWGIFLFWGWTVVVLAVAFRGSLLLKQSAKV